MILLLIVIESDLNQFELIPNLLRLERINLHLVSDVEDIVQR